MQDRSSGCRHCRRPSRKGAPYRLSGGVRSRLARSRSSRNRIRRPPGRTGKSNGIRSKDRLASTGRRDPAVARGERKRHDAGFADGFHFGPEGGKMEAVVDCHRGESDLAGLSRSGAPATLDARGENLHSASTRTIPRAWSETTGTARGSTFPSFTDLMHPSKR